MRRARQGRHVADRAPQPWRARNKAALIGTACVVLVATGGVVSGGNGKQAHHLMALGPHNIGPGAGPVTTTPPPPTTTTTTTTLPPLEVLSISPAQGAEGVASGMPVTVVLSGPPRADAPMPALVPAAKGQWTVNGSTLTFTPSFGYAPWSTEHIVVPTALAGPERSSFHVAGIPLLRVQQLLAELRYLPLDYGPRPGVSGLSTAAPIAALVSPRTLPGAFTWRFSTTPASLKALWTPGKESVVTTGALMHFEAVENLPEGSPIDPQLWGALKKAVASRATDPVAYDYLLVSEALPEQLVVWRNGADLYKTPVNTGVPGAWTETGTYPVYARFWTTTMIGTDVDGYHYDVPNVPWVAYFNGGDAVHGYWRSSYGYPQSNGCVELPIDNAQVVWSMDPIGTLVNVSA
jgi:lipoprotein-anchoring transpeptidase ErfK/SrfK